MHKFLYMFHTCTAAFLSSAILLTSCPAFIRADMEWFTSFMASSCCRCTFSIVSLYSFLSRKAWSHCRMAKRKTWQSLLQSLSLSANNLLAIQVIQPTLIALLLELVSLEEDLAIQLLVSDHLLLLQRKMGIWR